jgi:hypothetical protein
MPDYEVMKHILGKTIKGVIVKKNPQPFSQPAMAVHLFFTDGTSYEIYSAPLEMNFAGGLNRWSMDEARKYLSPPMENVLDIAIDEG